ncbi:DUF1592 domain-containing protein [Stieleria sp. TO1_6]|uniref:DUF1592 domain-containing protein n=1 Tax=Stieleria tagensis TaxID=2956795 RepID=UPI00209A7005|nr:DUF1592 domain-containing protein [Stieleria tagensis]MCO8124177.1 DUF1592 domain-containing protein [Stieleria tagensis]
MRNLSTFVFVMVAAAQCASALPARGDQSLQPAIGGAFLQQHCNHCHDDATAEGGLDLANLKLDADDPANLAKWARIHDRVDAGEMPPADEPRPDDSEVSEFVALTRATLRDIWKQRYATRGRVGGRRLNPVEYEYTLRDLLAAPWLELKEMLPPDPEAHGFDNVAEAQEISYVQLARYLDAAEVAIDGAMRLRPAPKPTTLRTWFSEEGRYLGRDWKERLGSLDNRPEWTWFWQQPNSAQAPRRIRNTSQQVPGWYRFRVRCRAALWDNGQLLPPQKGQVAWVNTAAKRVLAKFDVPEAEDGGIVEFIAWQRQDELLEFFCATMDDRQVSNRTQKKDAVSKRKAHEEFMATYRGHGIAVDWFEIEGPFADESCDRDADPQPWPADSYRRLFGDLPMQPWTKASGLRPPEPLNLPDLTANKRGLRETFQLPPEMMMVVSANPHEDAERLLRSFLERAYRRVPEESEVQRCLAFSSEAIERKACFQDAMRLGYKAALCSPDFLYLQEMPGKLDGRSLASRLSYLLWRSLPDDELIAAADSGELLTDTGLKHQFDRMLRDSKSQRFIRDFTGQWLDLRNVHDTSPDPLMFPEYFCDNHLVESGVAETEQTFAEMIRANQPIQTIVRSEFAMVNERLAELYGIKDVHGMQIRPVRLSADTPRCGLLTQSSIMKVTANGLTTSPVLRGVWVIDRILGMPPAPPPPGAGSIEPDTRGATTVREQLAKHSQSESCAGCHASIDPPGFALECFDVMGSWRDHYRSLGTGDDVDAEVALRKVKYKQGPPVDASGVTKEGQVFENIYEFRDYLANQDEQLARNLTRRLLTFATGAGVSFADRDVIESILDENSEQGYPIRSLFQAVVLSELFRNK